MSRELPYFQFEPAEYIAGNISFCSLQAQGMFINVLCYYWQRGCRLTEDQLIRRIDDQESLNELKREGVITIDNGEITIKFLDQQFAAAIEKSSKAARNANKRWSAKANDIPIECDGNAMAMQTQCDGNAIRRDNIRKEDKREYNKDENQKFSFKTALLSLGVSEELVTEWLKVRKAKKAINSKIAFDGIEREIKKASITPNEAVRMAVENSWKGFQADWVKDQVNGKAFRDTSTKLL